LTWKKNGSNVVDDNAISLDGGAPTSFQLLQVKLERAPPKY
jgi:hypothetical protein